MPAYARAPTPCARDSLPRPTPPANRAKCIVIGHKEDGVLAAFEEARKRGVRVIVGPLLRDDLKTLVLADPEIPWTIALNQLDDRAPMPAAVYSFALTIEADAHLLARRARYDGVHAIDVIAGDPPIMKRLATTFAGDWIASGGTPPADLHFDPAPEMLSQLRRNLARAAPDAVLLAVDGNHAALVKSYVGTLPAYASGLVFERPDPAVVRDLNDVRVAEIPWLVTPDAPQFANYPRRDFGSAALDRLYALGLDAFRVSRRSARSARTLHARRGHGNDRARRRPSIRARRPARVFIVTGASSRSTPRRADAGARAESLAAAFLGARGLVIVARNFRTRRGEIDLIARDGTTLVFVEVRMRRSPRSAAPRRASPRPSARG